VVNVWGLTPSLTPVGQKEVAAYHWGKKYAQNFEGEEKGMGGIPQNQ